MKRAIPFTVGLFLVGSGIAAMLYDKRGAALYGLPTEDKQALGFARAAGARDIAIGAMLIVAPSKGRPLLLAANIVSVLDFLNVLVTAEQPPPNLAIHAGGAVGLAILALLTPGSENP